MLPRWPPIMLWLLAAAPAIADVELTLPADFARMIDSAPFAALLASLPGTASAARGVPVLALCRIQWMLAGALARDIASRYVAASIQPILSRMKATPSAENVARSLLSLP